MKLFFTQEYRGNPGVNARHQALQMTLIAMTLAGAHASAVAASAPLDILKEDFENTAQAPALLGHAKTLDEYVSAALDFNGDLAGVTYTAEGSLQTPTEYTGVPFWLNKQYCNGLWLSANAATDPYPTATLPPPYIDLASPSVPGAPNYCFASGNTAAPTAWKNLQILANVLGQVANPNTGPLDTKNQNNHVIAAFTQTRGNVNSPSTSFIQLKMNKAVPLPTGTGSQGRFVTLSVAMAAMNCAKTGGNTTTFNPHFDFYLIKDTSVGSMPGTNDSNLVRLTSSSIDPCLSGQHYTAQGTTPGTLPEALPPTNTNNYEAGVRANQYNSDTPVLVMVNSVALQMINTNASGQGNDAALDNFLVQDVTPDLSKSFGPSPIANGGTSTLTFTVTNTTDKLIKSGWEFFDNLPAGMTVAATPNITNTCGGTTAVAAAAGSSTVNVTQGYLAAGAASCQVSVDVTAKLSSPMAAATVLVNAAGNAISPGTVSTMGLNPPNSASLVVTPAADMQATGAATQETEPGKTVTVETMCTNNGPDIALNATCVVSGVPSDASNVSTICRPVSGSTSILPTHSLECTTTFTPSKPERITLITTAGTQSSDLVPNNTAPSVVDVLPLADMQSTTVISSDGGTSTVTSTCTNAGPSTAVNASCLVSGAPADAVTTCKPGATTATLPITESMVCTTTFATPQDSDVTLTTTAGSSTTDPVPTNNISSATVTAGSNTLVPTPVSVDARWMLLGLAAALAFLGLRRTHL